MGMLLSKSAMVISEKCIIVPILNSSIQWVDLLTPRIERLHVWLSLWGMNFFLTCSSFCSGFFYQ